MERGVLRVGDVEVGAARYSELGFLIVPLEALAAFGVFSPASEAAPAPVSESGSEDRWQYRVVSPIAAALASSSYSSGVVLLTLTEPQRRPSAKRLLERPACPPSRRRVRPRGGRAVRARQARAAARAPGRPLTAFSAPRRLPPGPRACCLPRPARSGQFRLPPPPPRRLRPGALVRPCSPSRLRTAPWRRLPPSPPRRRSRRRRPGCPWPPLRSSVPHSGPPALPRSLRLLWGPGLPLPPPPSPWVVPPLPGRLHSARPGPSFGRSTGGCLQCLPPWRPRLRPPL